MKIYCHQVAWGPRFGKGASTRRMKIGNGTGGVRRDGMAWSDSSGIPQEIIRPFLIAGAPMYVNVYMLFG